MIAARSTAGTGCLLRARLSTSGRFRSVPQSRHFNTTFAYSRGTQPAQAAQHSKHRRSIDLQAAHFPRIFSAAFSTCGAQLFEETHALLVSKNNSTRNQARPDRQIRKMAGKPCPGCGSPFQTHHPDKPGYLAVNYDSLGEPKSTFTTTPTAELSKLSLSANAMNHVQYEKYLETLDPEILKEMGHSTDTTTSSSTPEPSGSTFEAEKVESRNMDKIYDRKPTPLSASRLICYRCHSILHHTSPNAKASRSSSSSVVFPSSSGSESPKMNDLIRVASRIMVVVVDLMDFPLSMPQVIVEELLKKKKRLRVNSGPNIPTPVIIVGNKFDLMPLGTRKSDVIQSIRQYMIKHDLHHHIYDIQVLSAKHPSGDEIRQFIGKIVQVWPKACKGSVVIVGAENVGKSQLMNAILMEGVRKGMKQDVIEQLELDVDQRARQRKLNALLGDADVSGGSGDEEWGTMTGNNTAARDAILNEASPKSRGLKKYNEYNVTVSNVPGTTMGRIKVPLGVLSKFFKADYKDIDKKSIMDTPGFKHSNGQISDWLTLEELKVTLPTKMLKPMSFTLEEGKSILLGGLVRIDCIAVETDACSNGEARQRGSNPQPKITIFSALPLHKTSIENADKFMAKTKMGELTVLQPPFGSPERLSVFPGLAPAFDRDMVIVNDPIHYASKSPSAAAEYSSADIDPYAKLDDRRSIAGRKKFVPRMTDRDLRDAELQLAGRYGICDVVFSGIGWVMISGKFQGPNQPVTLRIWTPKGQGAMIRDVCLLPELAVNPIEKTAGGIRQTQKLFQDLPNV